MSKLIPFRWLPGSWGLTGKSFDEAEARYSLEGFDLDLRLAEINHTGIALDRAIIEVQYNHGMLTDYDYEVGIAGIDLSGAALLKAQADIDKKHGLIDEYEWMRQHILAETSDTEQEVELIKLDVEFKKLDKREGEKKIACLLKEPWVSVVEEGLDPAQGPSGFYFVFDWNDEWIALLRKHGYEGESDDELMERWFTDVCRNEVMQSAPIPFNSSIVYE